MQARLHEAMLAKPGSGGRRAAAPFVVAVLTTMLAWGCGTPGTPSPSTLPPAATSTPAASPTASPSPAFADTLTIGWNPSPGFAIYGFRGALEGQDWHQISLGSVVYGGVYWYDARYAAVPDLADGPCQPRGDGTIIRCHLIDATFQDGTPLTADDVAYSYQLFTQSTFSGGTAAPGSWYPNLAAARVVDARTVDFVLKSVDPAFLITGLATPVLPRHAVEAAYAAFVTATKGLKAADLTKLADAIDAETSQDPPVCAPHLDEAAALLARIGVPLYREDFARNGTFDACGWVGEASWLIRMAAASLATTGLASVAAAYVDLSVDWRPIGTGPYRFVSEDANDIRVEAWPGYHGGMAATRFIDFVPAKGDGSDLVAGGIDIYQPGRLASLGPAFQATAASRGLRVATLLETGYRALEYNVRPGRLFADLNLRRALQLCIDLPRDVDAATGGTGTPTYGPVIPGTWAEDHTIPRPARDVAAARGLIEGAGWKLGPDGVYAKGGTRLAAAIVVRGDAADRVKMADLIAAQAGDCGMDLRSLPTSWDRILNGLLLYPHLIPGTKTPFDLYIGGWNPDPDPDSALETFVSANVTDARHPNGSGGNGFEGTDWTGFSDPVLDALVKEAKATYDQAEQTRLYRQAQQELAAQQPYLFLWAANSYDIVRSAVSTVAGPLDLTTPNWGWQPQRLVVATTNP
jgi:ABC-type transport system substrate-binding protein